MGLAPERHKRLRRRPAAQLSVPLKVLLALAVPSRRLQFLPLELRQEVVVVRQHRTSRWGIGFGGLGDSEDGPQPAPRTRRRGCVHASPWQAYVRADLVAEEGRPVREPSGSASTSLAASLRSRAVAWGRRSGRVAKYRRSSGSGA